MIAPPAAAPPSRRAQLERARGGAARRCPFPSPVEWHPGADNRAYRRHVQTVLRRMSRAGWLAELIWRHPRLI